MPNRLTATSGNRYFNYTKNGVLAALLAVAVAITGCTTNPYTGEEEASNKAKGAGIGAAAGAVIGAIAGGSRRSVLLGAGIGALSGLAVGAYMDREEEKLRAQLQGTGVSVTRSGNNIILNMPGNITFATGSSNINANFYEILNSVALVVNEFEQTYIDITGHTDNVGAADYNMQLSLDRASSVARYLQSQQVLPERILTRGMGLEAPIASNDTPEGRAQNRRVELMLTPIT
ncbi:MAG: OmpA family protein [Gammaproteobacteria bacterium]|nr:MAG: OmpA family protein [Gammaproteobacteria bacterium]